MADLRIKDLVVEYAKGEYRVRPIDGLSLDVSEGSLAILLGPSGCGKTTLLSCLGGILSPSAGRIEFGDIDLTKLDERELSHYRRNTVGIVFQAFNLVSSLTALENVMIPLRAARVPRRGLVSGPRSCWTASDWPTGWGTGRAISAAASSSGWPWPERSRSIRR